MAPGTMAPARATPAAMAVSKTPASSQRATDYHAGAATMDSGSVALASPADGARPSFFRRRRRTLALSALAVVFAAAMVIVWRATSGGSSSSSSFSSNRTTKPSANASTSVSADGASASVLKLPPRRRSIVVLGDSTTQYGGYAQGWETRLRETYGRSLDTFNRGLSGYNTRVYLQYAMPGIIEEATHYYDPLVVVLWFGVNDATLANGPNKAQHVPVDEYKENLIAMAQQFRNATPNASVLLLSPVYVDEIQRHKAVGTSLDRNNEETAKYAQACSEIKEFVFADDDMVGFVDVYKHFVNKYGSDSDRALLLKDGLHFTPEGDRVFFELVKDKIEDMVPSEMLKTWQFPSDTKLIDY